jgi:hypothetical protein
MIQQIVFNQHALHVRLVAKNSQKPQDNSARKLGLLLEFEPFTRITEISAAPQRAVGTWRKKRREMHCFHIPLYNMRKLVTKATRLFYDL